MTEFRTCGSGEFGFGSGSSSNSNRYIFKNIILVISLSCCFLLKECPQIYIYAFSGKRKKYKND